MSNNLRSFLISKKFVLHVIIYLIVLVIVFTSLTSWLSNFTQHSITYKVPNFKGINVNQLDRFVSDKNVTYTIIDSLYDSNVAPGDVIKQYPKANMEVKQGREIFLYVSTSNPPIVKMPKLIDCSARIAITKIIASGLKLGKINFTTDNCINCVLKQEKDGVEIEPGTEIYQGSVIDFYVGKGNGNRKVDMPCLYGLHYIDAIKQLVEASLGVGAAFFENKKSNNGVVYKQFPSCDDFEPIDIGSSVDLYFTNNKSKVPDIPVDSTKLKKKLPK